MQNLQKQYRAYQVRIGQVTQHIKRFQQELASGTLPVLSKPSDDPIEEQRQAVRSETDRIARYTLVQGALESAKREYLNLTGSRYGE